MKVERSYLKKKKTGKIGVRKGISRTDWGVKYAHQTTYNIYIKNVMMLNTPIIIIIIVIIQLYSSIKILYIF